MPHDFILAKLLANNAQWACDVEASDPEYFPTLANTPQRPGVLWIGCADSRTSEAILTGSKLGEIFVHRNIANQFQLDDDNALSVLEYAVGSLEVPHIVVVGHTHCGGVSACAKAATQPPKPPTSPLERWLVPLTEIARERHTDPNDLTPLVEENVRAQVANIAKTDVVQRVWADRSMRSVKIHGWVFDLETGRLRDLGITESGPKA